eukprot:4393105-Amphidinium_carterae.1
MCKPRNDLKRCMVGFGGFKQTKVTSTIFEMRAKPGLGTRFSSIGSGITLATSGSIQMYDL